jgi:two-component system, chemotaxis family, chemotaxis protein CheY
MAIMIVEDEVGIREMLTVLLKLKGYATLSAGTGAAALDLLRECSTPPELILLDMMMPIMDGAAFRQAQLQQPEFAPIPVVLMSASANLPQQARALQAAATLPKPIDFDTLLALVEQYCLQAKQRGAS